MKKILLLAFLTIIAKNTFSQTLSSLSIPGFENSYVKAQVFDSANKVMYLAVEDKKIGRIKILKYDGTNWAELPGELQWSIEGMCLFKGELYVKGVYSVWSGYKLKQRYFQGDGTETKISSGIARFDGTKWLAVPPFRVRSEREERSLYFDRAIGAGDPGVCCLDFGADTIFLWNGNKWSAFAFTHPESKLHTSVDKIFGYQGQIYILLRYSHPGTMLPNGGYLGSSQWTDSLDLYKFDGKSAVKLAGGKGLYSIIFDDKLFFISSKSVFLSKDNVLKKIADVPDSLPIYQVYGNYILEKGKKKKSPWVVYKIERSGNDYKLVKTSTALFDQMKGEMKMDIETEETGDRLKSAQYFNGDLYLGFYRSDITIDHPHYFVIRK